MDLRPSILALTATLALSACSSSDSKSSSFGGERRANSRTADQQQFPAVARNTRGDGVIVWESFGQDGSHLGIFGQRTHDGQPAGGEFAVNTYTVSRQSFPAVAMDASGNFVVAWRSSGQQSPGGTIIGRRYGRDGLALGDEFRIGADDSEFDSQSEPSVAMTATGEFAVAWSNRALETADELNGLALTAGLSLERRVIQARLYAADGTPVTGALNVTNPLTSLALAIVRAPAVGIRNDGAFTVTWISDGTPPGIRARRYTAAGTADGMEFAVSPSGMSADHPALAMAPSGEHVIAWESDASVVARRYAADGSAGEPFAVSSRDAGMQERVAAGIDGRGRFAIAASGNTGVFVQRYDASATPVGATEEVSTAGFHALFPALAMDADGGMTLAWHSFRQDGDGRGVYFRESPPL